MEVAIAETSDETVGSLGEFGLIRALSSRMSPGPFAMLGVGDDSAIVAAPSGGVVAAVDLVLEGRHFLRSRSSGYDVGVKAAARSLADIAAMGAIPTALLVAFAAPASLPASWALDVGSGLAYEAGRAGAGVVGGDTASADSVLLSVTALGDMDGLVPVRRSGASVGDVVAVAGRLGYSAAGLALLDSGVAMPEMPVVAAHLRPAPHYDAGPEAARLGATAMIDISDGLVADLGHIAAASGVSIDLSVGELEPILGSPLTEAALAMASAGSSSPGAPASPGRLRSMVLDWVLTGGEDHALVATFPASTSLPTRWRVIGEVRSSSGGRGDADADADAGEVTVDGRPHVGVGGWRHFR